jgi:hypothetical protein
MADTDDTSKARGELVQTIEAQRAQLLQAHGVLTCVYQVLLHADGDDAISCAQATHVAANLVNKSVEDVDGVHIGPLIDALMPKRVGKVDESRVLDRP